MRAKYKTHLIHGVISLFLSPAFFPGVDLWANETSKYLDAVREFADNVLKYGRDTYGPKHTPLFVDGLMVRDPNDPNYGKDGVFKPVEWIAPNGDRWILSNLASQQNLFRTLDGLTRITGDPKYKQAAMDAIKYAFENLRSPNGLLYWGECALYDADADRVVYGIGQIHSFKSIYPHYELMWTVDPNITKQLIESLWAVLILDWSNLDMNRYGPFDRLSVAKGWDHEYKGGPVFLEGRGIPFDSTGSALYYAAAILSKLSGQKDPLVWAKRLAYRYVETRDPRTGISGDVYTKGSNPHALAEDFKGHVVHQGTIFCDMGGGDPSLRRPFLHIYILSPGLIGNYDCRSSICELLIGDLLGDDGKAFQQWALEELSARGKVAYRREDNSWIPMLADGTSLEGYVCKRNIQGFARKGSIIEAWQADLTDFWAYALAYNITGDKFMWEMSKDIAKGNHLGDIGAEYKSMTVLNTTTDCVNAHALLGFLSLYERTQKKPFLDIAKRIGDNILSQRFHAGFFAPSGKHIYTKFDNVESLVLLHLHAAIDQRSPRPAMVWPSNARFAAPYRAKEEAYDIALIYTLTESTEPPVSLGEAAKMGDDELVRLLIAAGADVNDAETGIFFTPLHCAATRGYTNIVELLLSAGADVDESGDWRGETPLHCAAALRDARQMIELLLTNGAEINATSHSGDTPLQYAAYVDNKDIIELLLQKGAKIANLHIASYMGDLEKAETFINESVDINALDGHGYSPLHYAVQNNQKEAIELLIAKGADVNVKGWQGQTPLDIAVNRGDKDIAELLLNKGADANSADNRGNTLLHRAALKGQEDLFELLIDKGADINAKNNNGQTPLDIAVNLGYKDIAELLLNKGANINSVDNRGNTLLHHAAQNDKRDVAELLIDKGADINAKNNKDKTPLHYAVKAGNVKIVELLISRGANTKVLNKAGRTPLDIAVVRRRTEIAEILRKYGAKEEEKEKAPESAPAPKEYKPVDPNAVGLKEPDSAGCLVHGGGPPRSLVLLALF